MMQLVLARIGSMMTPAISFGCCSKARSSSREAMIVGTLAAMQAQGDVSAEQVREPTETMAFVADIFAYAGVIFILLLIAVVALGIWLLGTVMGGQATFGRSFALASAAGADVIDETRGAGGR